MLTQQRASISHRWRRGLMGKPQTLLPASAISGLCWFVIVYPETLSWSLLAILQLG